MVNLHNILPWNSTNHATLRLLAARHGLTDRRTSTPGLGRHTTRCHCISLGCQAAFPLLHHESIIVCADSSNHILIAAPWAWGGGEAPSRPQVTKLSCLDNFASWYIGRLRALQPTTNRPLSVRDLHVQEYLVIYLHQCSLVCLTRRLVAGVPTTRKEVDDDDDASGTRSRHMQESHETAGGNGSWAILPC